MLSLLPALEASLDGRGLALPVPADDQRENS
jgi:hypothetical protein